MAKIQKRLVSSLGGRNEFVGSDELENGRNFTWNESNTSVRLGHMYQNRTVVISNEMIAQIRVTLTEKLGWFKEELG